MTVESHYASTISDTVRSIRVIRMRRKEKIARAPRLTLASLWSLSLFSACASDGASRAAANEDASTYDGVQSAPGAWAPDAAHPGGSVASGGNSSGASGTDAGRPGAVGGALDGGHAPASGGSLRDAGFTTDAAVAVDGGDDASDGSRAAGDDDASARCTGPVGRISGALATGIDFRDTDGERVNAHGGGIIKEGDTFYLHGELFLSTTSDNNFHGFSMYSSKDLATWKNEGIILPQQASGELGPNRKGERPHIIKCPKTGEFVLYAHAASADYKTDREVVYATSPSVTGPYEYAGPLKNANGQIVAHSDMSAYADETGAYVLTESGHVFTLADDCRTFVSDKSVPAINGDSGGAESPVVFKAGATYYWIGSYKTGWRANNNFYSTAPAITGPWTFQGFIAPVADPKNSLSDERTWLSQSTWVQPVEGCAGTVYVYLGDHWDGNQDTKAPGKHNALATYVFQPLIFDGTKISMPTYLADWKLDVGAGTWSR